MLFGNFAFTSGQSSRMKSTSGPATVPYFFMSALHPVQWQNSPGVSPALRSNTLNAGWSRMFSSTRSLSSFRQPGLERQYWLLNVRWPFGAIVK